MRTLAQILIIIFVILSVYIVKDDLKVAYNNLFSYIENVPKPTIPDFQNILENLKVSQSPVEKVGNEVETPGPLRVDSNVLTDNTEGTSLSKSAIIDETNRNRLEVAGLGELKENQKLDDSAKKKVSDMFAKQYFEHVSPSGVSIAGLAGQVGYEYITIGENLALGNFIDSKNLLDAWMASPGHRANILNKNYTEIGVAVGYGVFEGKKVWLAVQHFGLPRNVCPTIDSVLKTTIELNQKNLLEKQKELVASKGQIDTGALVEGKTINEQIDNYNQIASDYNKIVSDIKKKISEYNTQVKSYNSCLSLYE